MPIAMPVEGAGGGGDAVAAAVNDLPVPVLELGLLIELGFTAEEGLDDESLRPLPPFLLADEGVGCPLVP